MKKLLVLLGILAAFSFVACNNEADPINPPASDPIENPTDTPDVPDTPDTPEGPEAPAFDGSIDLTGKTVKNEKAFAKAFDGGLVISFDVVDISDYKELQVEAKFYGDNDAEIAADWGKGQFLLLKDATGGWDEGNSNIVKTQYNLGMQQMDISAFSGEVTGIVIQNSSDDVKFIEVTAIKFVK